MFHKFKLDKNFIQNNSIKISNSFLQNFSKISLILFSQISPEI